MASLDLSGISKKHGNSQVIRNVTLAVEDGDFITLVGPSGCGKSTLLRIISGLDLQDDGEVRIDGADVGHLPPKLRDVAMVFQSYALYPHMSVYQNMAIPLVLRRLNLSERLPVLGRMQPGARDKRAIIDTEVRRAAAMLELDTLLQRRPAQLSGGQRQRVALGRAMVRNPRLFLMDEPLSNLDAKLRVHMRAEIAALHKRLGATFIYVTHDQIEAMTLSSRVAVMMDGEILQFAIPSEIYSRPANLRVAEFIGTPKINLLNGTVRMDGAVDLAGVTISADFTDRVGDRVVVGIRPEGWHIVAPGPATIRGKVLRIEQTGPEAMVYFTLPDTADTMAVRSEPAIAATLRPDEIVGLSIPHNSALFFDRSGDRIVPQGQRHG